MQKEERTFIGKSLDLGKRDSRQSVHNDLLADCVTKIKRYQTFNFRTVVGDNITIPSFSLTDSKAVKAHIYSLGATLIFEQVK